MSDCKCGHDHSSKHSMHKHDSMAEQNKVYWHSVADDVYKNKWVEDLQKQIRDHLNKNLEWFGAKEDGKDAGKKMLEYACGNGLPSRVLFPYFAKNIGVDIAQGMVDQFNAKARESNHAESDMYAIQGNLTEALPEESPLQKPEFFNFDLIVICLALHHIQDAQNLVNRLVERLGEGGRLVVIDWASGFEKDGVPEGKHDASHTITHGHYSAEEVEGMFKVAGCKATDFVEHEELSYLPMQPNTQFRLFFAKGTK